MPVSGRGNASVPFRESIGRRSLHRHRAHPCRCPALRSTGGRPSGPNCGGRHADAGRRDVSARASAASKCHPRKSLQQVPDQRSPRDSLESCPLHRALRKALACRRLRGPVFRCPLRSSVCRRRPGRHCPGRAGCGRRADYGSRCHPCDVHRRRRPSTAGHSVWFSRCLRVRSRPPVPRRPGRGRRAGAVPCRRSRAWRS